jgi:hypothetical protein
MTARRNQRAQGQNRRTQARMPGGPAQSARAPGTETPDLANGEGLEAWDDELENEDAEEVPGQPPSQPGGLPTAPAAATKAGSAPKDASRPGAKGRPPSAPGTGGETLPYVDDPVSRWWVVAVAVVFGLVFLYAILLGQGSLTQPKPTPTPVPTPIFTTLPTVSPTPAGSPTAAPSGSAATPTPAATSTPAPTASPASPSPGSS